MKRLSFPFLLLTILIGIFSCSEDFKVAAPYKDITVVHGLLDIRDTAHYIRIQKAFMDENKSAVDMAKASDSSFYNSLDVKVKEVGTSNVFTLDRVNMRFEGYPKDSGAFFQDTSWAYKFKAALNPAHRYRLVISNAANGLVDSSEISIIDTTDFKVGNVDLPTYRIAFTKTVPSSQKISFIGQSPKNSSFVEGVLRFRWTEKNVVTGTQQDQFADFKLNVDKFQVNSFTLSGLNVSLYAFLHDEMHPAPANVERYLDSCDFFVYAGGIDLYDYSGIIQNQTGGLTGDQVKPIFTNILGKDVFGLFSTRTSFSKLNIPISSETLDSLKTNIVTQSLNIKGVSDH